MYDHTFGLVDHEHIVVLIQYIQRDIFRQYIGYDAYRQSQFNLLVLMYFCAGLDRLAVQKSVSVLNECLEIASRMSLT